MNHLLPLLLTAFASPLFAQRTVTVRIDPRVENPPDKPGYHLILADEFTAFDTTVWDVSEPGDDGPGYRDPGFCRPGVGNGNDAGAPNNQSNVLGIGDQGELVLQTRAGEDNSACPYSGAEIKSWTDWVRETRGWKTPRNALVEFRVTLPDCPGVGSAGWLYGPAGGIYSEIDLWELYGDQRSAFQSNFIHGPAVGRTTQAPTRVRVRDLADNPVILGAQPLTFAVRFDSAGIRYLLNNVPYKTVRGFGRPLKRIHPYNVRVGISGAFQGTPADCDSLPQLVQLDYVRIYVPVGARATEVLAGARLSLRAGEAGGDNLRFTFFPNTTYTTPDHPHLRFEATRHEKWCKHFWVSLKTGARPGVYEIPWTITFPTGHVETITTVVEVN